MGFRFQRRVKIAKGVRLNLSKSGVSTSFGRPGFRINIGRRSGITTGIPGTGLSYRSSLGGSGGLGAVVQLVGATVYGVILLVRGLIPLLIAAAPVVGAIFLVLILVRYIGFIIWIGLTALGIWIMYKVVKTAYSE